MQKRIPFIIIGIIACLTLGGVLLATSQSHFLQARVDNEQQLPVCGYKGVNLPGCLDGAEVDTTKAYDIVLNKILPTQASSLLGVAGLVAVITIMVAGLMYLTALGDAAKTKKAFGMLKNTLAGLAIGLLAYVLVQLALNLNFSPTSAVPVKSSSWIEQTYAQDVNQLIPPAPVGNGLVNIPVSNPELGLGGFIEGGINVLFYVAGPISIIVFFIMGIKLVNSDGKDDVFKKTMQGIGYGALGLSLMGLAYAIARTILTIRL